MKLSNDKLMIRARDLVLAMMSCATTDNIKPLDWWPRALSALQAAANRATTWGQVVDIMSKKLQIQTLRVEVSKSVCLMALTGSNLSDWKRVVRTEGVYIIAEAQFERDIQRAAKEADAKEAGK